MQTKLFLFLIIGVIFCSFQYGGPSGDAPFENTWQAYLIGFVWLISFLLLTQEFVKKMKNVI